MFPPALDNDWVIDRLQRNAASAREMLSLAGGLPAESLFPRRVIASATLRALRQTKCAALQYGWPEGAPALREWIAERLAARGASVTPDDVVVTSGAQQAIALAIDAVLTRGDTIAVDGESYPAALDLFRARGLVPTTSAAASMAYVMPGVTNPRGVRGTRERLRALLDSGAPLIADEAFAELRFDGVVERPLLAEARGRTFHVGTFSKTLCPGFRIGWLIPPSHRRADVLRLKAGADLQANSLSQSILSRMVQAWDYDAHLARARRVYARRADALLDAVRRRLPASFDVVEPEGGFSIFVETDAAGDDAHFLELAARHGTSFDPGRLFRADPGVAPLSFRLCHSSIHEGSIDEAVARLARAFSAFEREKNTRRFATPSATIAHRRT